MVKRIYLNSDLRNKQNVIFYHEFIGWRILPIKKECLFFKKVLLFDLSIKKYRKSVVALKVNEISKKMISVVVV